MPETVIRDLEFYLELAKRNHRGLVPMIFEVNAMPYVIGDIAGFPPKDARAMHGQGQAKPYFDEAEGLEDDDYRPSYNRGSALDSQALSADEISRLDALEVAPTIFAEGKLQRIALAKQIKGIPPRSGGVNADMADDIIRAELSRRGQSLSTDDAVRGEAVAQRTGNAITSESGLAPGAGMGQGAPPETPQQ
jgi:hypothetical protein